MLQAEEDVAGPVVRADEALDIRSRRDVIKGCDL
jgi:hypothetical protein